MTVEDLANILHRLPRDMEIGIKCEGCHVLFEI